MTERLTSAERQSRSERRQAKAAKNPKDTSQRVDRRKVCPTCGRLYTFRPTPNEVLGNTEPTERCIVDRTVLRLFTEVEDARVEV